MWINAYKGFNMDMTCRGFQFREGETYEINEEVKLCNSGFHACEAPLDCLQYYAPALSEYHAVQLDATEERDQNDTKRVGRKIKIGARLSIKNLVDAQIEYVREHADKIDSSTGNGAANSSTGNGAANSSTGYMAANSSTGYRAANSSTGYGSANSSTGNGAANSSTGDMAANSSTGYMAANSSTGYGSANSSTGNGAANSSTGNGAANSSTGDMAANSSTGYRAANSSTGYRAANSSTGNGAANSSTGNGAANSSKGYGAANVSTGIESCNEGTDSSINIGWGKDNMCRGSVGAYLVLCERGKWDGKKYPLIGEPQLVKVDGTTIKADTWYTMRGGKIVEATEEIKHG